MPRPSLLTARIGRFRPLVLSAVRRTRVGSGSHHTVARLVAERDAAGARPERVARSLVIGEFLPKIEQWVQDSYGNIRADVSRQVGGDGVDRLGPDVPPRRRANDGESSGRPPAGAPAAVTRVR